MLFRGRRQPGRGAAAQGGRFGLIWCCDAKGVVNYIGPEWETFTGQRVADGLGDGCFAMIHGDDLEDVRNAFFQACRKATSFTHYFRLRRADGSYTRVVSGAAPSISPVDGAFVGFLGATAEVARLGLEPVTTRFVDSLKLPPPTGSTMPREIIDVMSDHVLLARSAAERVGDPTILASLDVTLSLIFVKLGGTRTAH